MKITITNKEIQAGSRIMEQIIAGSDNIARVFGDITESIKEHKTLTDEDVKMFNIEMKGIIQISKDNSSITFDISEGYVIDTCNLTADAVGEIFDVVKYAVKTVKAFIGLSIKPFIEKYKKIQALNMKEYREEIDRKIAKQNEEAKCRAAH